MSTKPESRERHTTGAAHAAKDVTPDIPGENGPREKRKKAIVLCSDGTGNRGGKGHGTNVWRLAGWVDRSDPDREQLVFYDDGVGTEDYKLFRLAFGAVGWGLSKNIRQLYRFLVYHYEPGDDIYLFGFSRGAFTVRSLSGLIDTCGILSRDELTKMGPSRRDEIIDEWVEDAFRAYRHEQRKRKRIGQVWNWINRPPKGLDTIRSKSHQARDEKDEATEPRIKCIGVWDTVGAIGAPIAELRWVIDQFAGISFHSNALSPLVDNGFHALAIDDERRSFHPVLWDESAKRDHARIEQVWFAGAHSNVGGGYPKAGLSNVSLYWMMKQVEAQGVGLRFRRGWEEEVGSASSVHDRLYDSRSGLGSYYRYEPRDLRFLLDEHPREDEEAKEAVREDDPPPARIHASVFDRVMRGSGDYVPGNLPEHYEIDWTGYEGHVSGAESLALGRGTPLEPFAEAIEAGTAGEAVARLASQAAELGSRPAVEQRLSILADTIRAATDRVLASREVKLRIPGKRFQDGLLLRNVWRVRARQAVERMILVATIGLVAFAYVVGRGLPDSWTPWTSLRWFFGSFGWLFGMITSPIDGFIAPAWAWGTSEDNMKLAATFVLLALLLLVARHVTMKILQRSQRRFWAAVEAEIAEDIRVRLSGEDASQA